MDFKKDIEPVLVSFIYGEINADQMIDILNNKIVKVACKKAYINHLECVINNK